MKIVVLDRKSLGLDVSIDPLNQYGEVTAYMTTKNEEVPGRVKDADVVVVNKNLMNAAALDGAENVKLICETATGFDNIDLNYCRERGITACNVVNYSTAAVVQHTFASALYVLEKLNYYDNYVKGGTYQSQPSFTHFEETYYELEGKTWGIIGMGNIGKKVAAVAKAFGFRVISYSARSAVAAVGESNDLFERVDFETLLKESDILSLHCPLTDTTRGIINKEALSQMKKSAVLVNMARGPVVNEEDLAWALENDVIRGAATDVMSKEPILPENPLNRIKDSRKLLITPHMAWASVEARTRVVMETCKNIEAFAKGEPRNVVS